MFASSRMCIHRPVPLRAVSLFVVASLGACARTPPVRPALQTPATRAAIAAPARATTSAQNVAGTMPAVASPSASSAAQAGDPALARQIDAFMAQPRFAMASWGVNVVSLDSGRTLYAHNAGKLAIPASNAKLYTASLALHELGSDYRITTSLYATAKPLGNGVLVGDLVLYGRGDPTLGSGSDSRSPQAWADTLAQALAARGVRRVHGDLIADDTYFAGTPIGAGWEAGDLQSWFAPPASALSVQRNRFVVRVDRQGSRCCYVTTQPAVPGLQVSNLTRNAAIGPPNRVDLYRAPGSNQLQVFGRLPAGTRTHRYKLSAPDPALLAGGLLRDALVRQSITLVGHVRAIHWPRQDTLMQQPGLVHVADIRSPPLRDIVKHTLKHSDNLYAQLLLLQVGARGAASGQCADRVHAPDTTAGWGLCAMRQMLAGIGINRDSALFEEGSGLSRKDRVTPSATTQLLTWIARQPFASVLQDALPVAGVDGTLHHRLRNTSAAENLRAKTGTLRYSYALSGYVTDADGQHLAFSMMLEGYPRPRDTMGRALPPSPRQDIDAIAAMLADHGVARRDNLGAH